MPEIRTGTPAYETELRDTLDRLGRENGHIRTFSYFTDCAYRWFDRECRKNRAPKVAVLGPGVPEELILAAGASPHFILGGSLRSTDWSDDMVPRDTDPVSRSVLGFLNQPDGPDYSGTLFIVPVCSDSMRKIAAILTAQGRMVHVVDIPPRKSDPMAREKWREQMRRMTDAAARHTHTRVTAGRLVRAVSLVNGARQALKSFLTLTADREDLLTGSGQLLVRNSYYYTEDLEAWTLRLRQMNDELRARRRRYARAGEKRPGVLLLGSPVYFPNYKVPFLLEDIGLCVRRSIDVTTRRPAVMEYRRGGRDAWIRAIADRWYSGDGSPAYTVNDALRKNVLQCLDADPVEGVVYHVLKGQIEYDFELERLEAVFDARGIPVFRLETDYQYQDVEQLRIRMEAFCEMLTQNRFREERKAQ